MSCDRSDYYWINTLPCSGHGDCIDNKCYCYNHWTGRGDFELDPHFDCDINYQVIRFLCIITLIIFSINLSIIFKALFKINFSYKHIGKDTKVTIYFCFLFDIISHRASNGVINISNNLFMVFFGLGWCYYYQIFTSFLQGYSKMVDKQYRDKINKQTILIDNFINYIMIFFVVAIICDDLILLYPNKSDKFAIGNLLGILCFSGSLVIACHLTVSVFVNEIGKYLYDKQNIEHKNIIKIYNQINILRYVIAIVFLSTVVSCSLFAIWSFLRRKISYLHQLFHILIGLIEMLLAYILLPKSTYNASIRQYLPIQQFHRIRSLLSVNHRVGSYKVIKDNKIIPNNQDIDTSPTSPVITTYRNHISTTVHIPNQ